VNDTARQVILVVVIAYVLGLVLWAGTVVVFSWLKNRI
jgi:hypothetical protein